MYHLNATRLPTLTVAPYGDDTAATLVVVPPSGTAPTPTPSAGDNNGAWSATAYPLPAVGEWVERWTVAGTGAGVVEKLFEVLAPGAPTDGDLPPLASMYQLAKRLGFADGEFPTDEQALRAHGTLVDASDLIRDEAEKTWVDDEDVLENVPRRVRKIALQVALRALDNPGAYTQKSIGDLSRSWDRAGLQGGEALYLTDEEKRAIRKAAGASSLVVVTLTSPYSGDDVEDDL